LNGHQRPLSPSIFNLLYKKRGLFSDRESGGSNTLSEILDPPFDAAASHEASNTVQKKWHREVPFNVLYRAQCFQKAATRNVDRSIRQHGRAYSASPAALSHHIA